jgi:hypothetical protein
MEMTPAATAAGGKPGGTNAAPIDFLEVRVQVEQLVHTQIFASDEFAFQESLDETYQLAFDEAQPETTEKRAEKKLEALFATVRSITEKSRNSSASIDKAAFRELIDLAASEGLALREQLLMQVVGDGNGLPRLQKAIDALLAELHRREREDGELLERLRKVLNHAGMVSIPDDAAETKSWLQRMFTFKKSPLGASWKDHSRWQLELVMLHSLCYVWHGLHASIAAFNEQLRELRQEMLALTEEFQKTDSPSEPATVEKRAIQSFMSKTWGELLRRNERAFIAKLDPDLRQLILGEFLGVGNAASKNTTVKAKAGILREAVRRELGDILREIDLAGMAFSSVESSANESPLLKTILEEAEPSHHADFGGAQRLLLACPANSAIDKIRKKIEKACQHELSVAVTTSPEVMLCYEVERVPPMRIAAQLLQGHSECREIALKLQARIDVAWPRGF